MDETEFNKIADLLLTSMGDRIDDLLGDHIDVELHAGILTLGLENGGQYVINKHGPNKEIWVSSPVSGAFHFRAVEGQWISTRNSQTELCQLLGQELGISII